MTKGIEIGQRSSAAELTALRAINADLLGACKVAEELPELVREYEIGKSGEAVQDAVLARANEIIVQLRTAIARATPPDNLNKV